MQVVSVQSPSRVDRMEVAAREMLQNGLHLKRMLHASCEGSYVVDGEGDLIHWCFGETRVYGVIVGRSLAKGTGTGLCDDLLPTRPQICFLDNRAAIHR